MIRVRALTLFGIVAIAACAEPPASPTSSLRAVARPASTSTGGTYVILAEGLTLSSDLVANVAAAGGSVTASLDGMGVIIATSDDPAFAERAGAIAGVSGVAADVVLEFSDPAQTVVEASLDETDINDQSHAIGGHETFRNVQWAPDAVSAPAAWALGYQGAGARVAILDGGIYSRHLDIAPRLDVARSRSMVPRIPYNADLGTFWHGTHVAGIVAAPANNIGTVGIAPAATIIGVKVLHGGSGAWSWILNGIYYAATPRSENGAGADIINMSLGAQFPKSAPGAVHLIEALNRATSYARERGVTVIAAAGNAATDIDHTGNVVFVPAMSAHVIAVSATGPLGFGLGATNFDRPAGYTNYGQSAINLAGPGGDSRLPGNALCSKPRIPTGVITTFCWVFDMVMAPCRGAPASISTYCWASGTSMASPAVAGVAALIIGKNGGPMHPAAVEAQLRQSADDLGKKGNDDYYGRGRVNALRAVQ